MNSKKEFYKLTKQIRNYSDPDSDMLNLLQSMKELLKDSDVIKKSSFFVYQNVRKLRAYQKNSHKGGVKRGKNPYSVSNSYI